MTWSRKIGRIFKYLGQDSEIFIMTPAINVVLVHFKQEIINLKIGDKTF